MPQLPRLGAMTESQTDKPLLRLLPLRDLLLSPLTMFWPLSK